MTAGGRSPGRRSSDIVATTVRVDEADDERLADYRLLKDHEVRRQHADDEFYVAEGYTAIERVIDAGHRLRSVLLTPSRVERFAHHLPAFAAAGIPVYVVDRELLAGTVGFSLHRGVLAAADRPRAPSVDELAASTRRLVAAEGLNDPENLGAIARAARALGMDGLIVDPRCTDPYSRRTVRVSMGEILLLPVGPAGDWPAALDVLHEHGFETWAMTPAADADDLWQLDPPERVAVVVGAEGPGLDRRTIERASRRVRIPIDPAVDSLNVGHAVAIACAAITRTAP